MHRPSGEYRRLWAGMIDAPAYVDLSPRAKWVLASVLLSLPAPFPSVLDREAIARASLIDVTAVDRVLARLVAGGLLVREGERFAPGTIDGHALVTVPEQFHARVRRVRRRIPRRVRELVAARDGYRCRQCGKTHLLELDHIEPWSLGGSDDPSNLQLLCGTCNRRKGPTAFITRRIQRGAQA